SPGYSTTASTKLYLVPWHNSYNPISTTSTT
ncbi:LOW QUALITY PROTEIN: hypothetical protein TorRG33x02_274280, partial [Trema orientale]